MKKIREIHSYHNFIYDKNIISSQWIFSVTGLLLTNGNWNCVCINWLRSLKSPGVRHSWIHRLGYFHQYQVSFHHKDSGYTWWKSLKTQAYTFTASSLTEKNYLF